MQVRPANARLPFLQASPLMDRIVFKKTKAAFGGRVRFVVSGGAPLGPSVEEFLHIALCCPVLQVRQDFLTTRGKGCLNTRGKLKISFDNSAAQCSCSA